MKFIAFIIALCLPSLFVASGCAAVQDDHKGHHSSAALSSSAASKENKHVMTLGDSVNHEVINENAIHEQAMEKMDSQMKAMRDIHNKMMRATSTDERKELAADHMKAMQTGMQIMKNMPALANHTAHHDKKASHDMDAMKCDMKEGVACDMKEGMSCDMKDGKKCDMTGMKSNINAGMTCCMGEGTKPDINTKHEMMEKRVEMMETMMQMMMDRMMNDDYDEHQNRVKK